MSEDKLNQAARKAYAEVQKESNEAREHKEQADQSKKGKKDKGKAGKSDAELKPETSVEDSSETSSEGAEENTETTGVSHPASEEASTDQLEGELAQAQEKRIAELKDELAKVKDELARAHADLYNLQQEYNAYARRTKAEVPLQQEAGVASVVNALMGVLDDIELARVHDDLKGSFGAVATKLEQTLETNFKVKRYGAKGDAFDPNLHQAIQMSEGAEGDKHVIDQVAQPGYLVGERVLRPAMVIVGTATSAEKGSAEAKSGEAASEGDSSTPDESDNQ